MQFHFHFLRLRKSTKRASKCASAFPVLTLLVLSLAGCAADSHHRAGLAAMNRGEYPLAVGELQKAAELEPRDVVYRQDWLQTRESATTKLLSKADTALAEGRPADAEQHYRSILSYDHDNTRATTGLETIARSARALEDATQAREALKHGDTALANQLANRALQRSPNQPEAIAIKRELDALQAKDILSAPSLSSLYKKPINLEFRDASVKMVFEALSRTTGINFIFDREVKGDQRTTVFLKQTTLEDAIDVILTTNQLDKKILNATSVLIYPNTAAKTKEYQDLMVKAFYLASSDAKQTANLLKTVLKIKEIFIDEKYNMLVLRETPDTIALAEKLIALHDLDEPEVMLEVEVLEVNRTKLLNLGVQLTSQLTVTPLTNLITSPLPGTTGGSQPTLSLANLSHLNKNTLGITLPSATVNMQKVDSDANLLANPRLRVRDREKANILIGDKVPVVTTTTTPNGFVSENIQYLDVGLKLEVEPEIHLRDEVGLKIGLEVSSIVASIKTSGGSQAYQIGTRNIKSALRLKDGETQVLAGLINDADRSDANRIPLLGDVPLLGRLFSSQKDDRQKTEIVMSITPHLIRNIQRKDPSAEAFWSGTEAALRTKPLQLRGVEVPAPAVVPNAAPATTPNAPAATNAPAVPGGAPAVNHSGIQLQWKGADAAKVGQTISLELSMDSAEALRAAPMQIAYNPAQFEIVNVKEGDFFTRNGKGSFNYAVDKASGRISIGNTSAEASGTKGNGKIAVIELKALAPTQEGDISVMGITPIGATQAIALPPVPVIHRIVVVQ